MSLKNKFPKVTPWNEGYDRMVSEGFKRDAFRKGNHQGTIGIQGISRLLLNQSVERHEDILALFSKDMYLPQEILNYSLLKTMWNKDGE